MNTLEVLTNAAQFEALHRALDPLAARAAEAAAMEAAVEYAYHEVYRDFPEGVSSQHTRDRFEKSVERDAAGNLTGYVTSPDIQALVLEVGRTPGAKMPPASALAEWVGTKLGDTRLAYVVARAIGREGIVAHHTFQAVAERTQSRAGSLFQDAIARALK